MDRFYQSQTGDANFLTLFYFEEVYGSAQKSKEEAVEDLSKAWKATANYVYEISLRKETKEPVYWCN